MSEVTGLEGEQLVMQDIFQFQQSRDVARMSPTADTYLGFALVCSLFALSFGALAWALFSAMQDAMDSYSDVYAEDTARQFEDVFLFIHPAQLTRIAYIAAVVVFMFFMAVLGDFSSPGGMAAGFIFGLAGGLGALQMPRIILRVLKQRRLEKFNAQLEDALSRMSNSLKAGFSILQAFESIVKEGQNPIAQEFGVFLQQLRVGVRFEDALAEPGGRVSSEDLTLTVRAIEIARQTGGNLTDVLGKIAETIRERPHRGPHQQPSPPWAACRASWSGPSPCSCWSS
jgi:tight adherence protein B